MKNDAPLNITDCVSLPAAAVLADVSERHMRLLVQSGKIPAAKVGRNWLVSRAAAVAFSRHPKAGRPRKG